MKMPTIPEFRIGENGRDPPRIAITNHTRL